MANRSRKSRSNSFSIGTILFSIFILAAVVAFLNIPVNPSVTGIWNTSKERSLQVEAWVKNLVENGSFRLPSPPPENVYTLPETQDLFAEKPNNTTTLNILENLTVSENDNPQYNRADWFHWENLTECWTVREQVLYSQALTVTLLDANNNITENVNEACSIKNGTWVDLYTGETLTNPNEIDIDHMIPLQVASHSGGNNWDIQKKREYANYLEYSDHLIAISADTNKDKGNKTPSDWKPKNTDYHCTYATNWVTISYIWELTITEADKKALQNMLKTCKTD